MVLVLKDVKDEAGDGVVLETTPANLAELRLVIGIGTLVGLFMEFDSSGTSEPDGQM